MRMAEALSRRNARMLLAPKALVASFYAASYGIGLLPYAMIVRSGWAWFILVAIAAITFLFATRSREVYSGESPSFFELTMPMLGRCAGAATIGMFGLGANYLVSTILGVFVADVTAAAWGFYVSMAVAIFFVVALTGGDAWAVLGALYPDRPGQRSPYFPLANEVADQLLLFLRVAGIAVGFAATVIAYSVPIFEPYATFVLLAWSVGMIVIGGDYLEVKTIDSEHGTLPATIVQVTALLEAAQYKVIANPRTGDADADSVISVLDFLALRPRNSMAGRIRAQTSRPGGGDVHHEAAMLEPAVWVLQDQLRKQGQTKVKLRPTLIVLGDVQGTADPAQSTTTTSAGTSVRIIQGPSEAQLAELVSSDDKGPLKAMAEKLFGSSVPTS
jgi:hypothetical protein